MQIIILSGEPTHTASKGSNGATCPSYINNCLKVKYPLLIFVSYFQMNQELHEKHLCNWSSHYGKIWMCCVPKLKVVRPSIVVWKAKYPSTTFNLLHSNTNQDLALIANMKIWTISIMHAKEAITCSHQIDTFCCQ